MSYINPDTDLIFYSDSQGEIHSGGFSVSSLMMKGGFSPIMTLNTPNQIGGSNKVSDLFNNLVVPNWALAYPGKMTGGFRDEDNYTDNYQEEEQEEEEDDIMPEDIHDQLLKLASVNDKALISGGKRKKTQRSRKNKNKNTKRSKN